MKRILNIFAIFLVIMSVLFFMASCNNDDKNDIDDDDSAGTNDSLNDDKDEDKDDDKVPVYKDYTVTVVDGVGTPISGVIVKFTGEDGVTKTRATEKDGTAVLKNALAGKYNVLVEQGLSSVTVVETEFTLTADITTYTTVVRDDSKIMDVFFAYDAEPDIAYVVGLGEYRIPCEAGGSSFVVLSVQKSGVYRVTLESEGEDMTVGYYGIPMFVQQHHCADGEYDGKTFELIIQDYETPYVIGVSSSEASTAGLKIERVSDAPFDPQYAPWTEVHATSNPQKITLPENATLKGLDISDNNLSVYLGDDGYYHTSDGKIVYLRIDSVANEANGDKKYLDVSIAFIAGLVDQNHGQNFGGYVYDNNGDFVGKYTYNNLLATYLECCDKGVYPLTAELAEAIKCHGNSVGWWTPGTANFLFDGVMYNKDTVWLFLCCTVE